MAKHGVCITEKLSGTFNGVDLVSVRYMVNSNPAAIDNGCVVVVGDLEDGSREIRKATAPAKDSAKAAIALIASLKLSTTNVFRATLPTLKMKLALLLVAICLRSPIRYLP